MRSIKLTERAVERLISEVEERIPLWDYNVPRQCRTRDLLQKLWEEVATAVGKKNYNFLSTNFVYKDQKKFVQ